MKPTALPSQSCCQPSSARAVLLEALAVTVIGAVLAFTLNAVSSRGLALGRDYFPGAARPSPPAVTASNGAPLSVATHPPTAAELAAARLKAHGLQLLDRPQTAELFHDLRYQHGAVVFVDARDDQHYQAGHIPGAHQFDHYRAPDYLPAVLPVCLSAEQIVVYCNGGDCEDSEFAAVTLRDAGVANEKLFVYGGGFTDWATNGLPVELGARGSGLLREEKK